MPAFCNDNGTCEPTLGEDNNGCSSDCKCGDGVIAPPEMCDDGNKMNDDACPDGAMGTCKPAECGDGHVKTGQEMCDDGNKMNDDACPDGAMGTCEPAKCGDGHVRTMGGQETCDDSNMQSADGCSDTCKIECLVFVTNGIYGGAFGASPDAALAAADAACQASATAPMPPLSGVYKAWLSNSTIDAKDHVKGCVGKFIRSGDGAVIASDWTTFSTGTHDAAINKNEWGETPSKPGDPQMPSPTTLVWTGTKVDGTKDNQTCTNWTSKSEMLVGHNGDYTAQLGAWTKANATDCNNQLHLYCVQTSYVP